MAVVDVKSSLITNRDANTPNRSYLSGGVLQRVSGTLEITNGDSIASIFRLFEIPTHATLHSLTIFCDAVTSATADFGLYQNTRNGGAVVDVDAYATAQSLASAITLGTEIAFEVRNIDKINNQVWQDGGATSDPQRTWDVCATLTAAATATGTLSFRAEYSIT